MRSRLLTGTILGGGALLLGISAAYAGETTPDQQLNAGSEANNWIMVHRTYDSHRFSPLKQITSGNVKNLHLAYVVTLNQMTAGGRYSSPRNENTPLVEDGFMYVEADWSNVYKIDLSDPTRGKIVWKYDPAMDLQWVGDATCCGAENRGMGFWKNQVIALTMDGRVMAIDKDTGELTWEVQRAEKDRAESFTGAPQVIGDTATYGPAGAEFGIRGWVEQLDLNTHEPKWRTYTIPAPGEPGSETWVRADTWKTGGGSIWQTGSYDPNLNLQYWGVGNPAPQIDTRYRPGDNLYGSSLLALDNDTGAIKWYFQFTPNDPYDYDEIGDNQLIEGTVNGQKHAMVIRAARNGFMYGFDRGSGEFLYGKQYVEFLNWTDGVDPKTGKPVAYDASAQLQMYNPGTVGTRDGTPGVYCPTLGGGKNWQPASYSEDTGYLYVTSNEGCSAYVPTEPPNPTVTGGDYNVIQPGHKEWNGRLNAPDGTKRPDTFVGGSVKAINALDGSVVAKVLLPEGRGNGMLSTAGGVVFTSNATGNITAYDAKNLDKLWEMNVGTSLSGPPISYAVNGKQYIAVEAGTTPRGAAIATDAALQFYTPQDQVYVFTVN